jgi:hypothetical protein
MTIDVSHKAGRRAGLRRSVVMSDFIEGDPEGGEGSGGSRALWRRAAARLTAGAAEHADRQVAQARHGVWAVPVRTWEASW